MFRNFPVTKVRSHAYETALAAEAAGVQGKFWEMYDYLFRHGQLLTNRDLRQSAAKLGLSLKNQPLLTGWELYPHPLPPAPLALIGLFVLM